jgi:hypothetical protein
MAFWHNHTATVLLGCVNTGVSQESAKIQDLPCTEGSAKAREGGLLLGVRQHAFESARYNAHEDDVLDTKKFVQNRCSMSQSMFSRGSFDASKNRYNAFLD